MHLKPVFGVSLLLSLAVSGLMAIQPARAEDAPTGYRTPYYTAGVQAYRAGDYDKAINYFRRVVTDDPANINAHYYLGVSLDHFNLGTEAVQEYQFVASNGHENRIVDYAKSRLNALSPQAAAAIPVANTQSVAMIAAGNQITPAVYQGTVARFAVPLKSNKNALMVDAAITQDSGHAVGTFIIDTGATYTSISQEMAEKLGLDLENCDHVFITTANGRIEVPKVIIKTLNVNGLEAHNVEATVIQVRKGSSFAGLLGLSFIRQFVLTIDPQAGQLVFQKN